MPSAAYRITTDQGTFEVETEAPVENLGELQRALTERLAGQATPSFGLIAPGAPVPEGVGAPSTTRIPTDLSSPDILGPIARSALPVGGFMAGGLLGAPMGPLVAVAGAGLGYGAGAGLERLRAGTPGPTTLPGALGQTGMDVAEGAGMEAGGQGAAGLIRALAGKLFPALAPEAAGARATLEANRIPYTAGEVRQGPLLGRTEATLERLPIGSKQLLERRATGQEATGAAVGRMADDFGPPGDIVETGRAVQKAAQGAIDRRTAAEAVPALQMQARVGATIAPRDAAQGVRQGLRQAERLAREEATAKYTAVKAAAGDAPAVIPTNLSQAAMSLLEDEARLAGVQTRAAAVAGRLEAATPPPSQVQTSIGPMDLSKLPAQTVREMGLDQPASLSLTQADAIHSRLQGLARQSRRAGNDFAAKQFGDLAKAMDQDIGTLAEHAPALKEAREFYRTRVADLYGPRGPLRDLGKTAEPGQLLEAVLSARTPERTALIRDELLRADPSGETWRGVQRHFAGQLVDAGLATDGSFNAAQFVRTVSQYPPESVTTILGKESEGLARAVGLYQQRLAAGKLASTDQDARMLYRELVKADPEAVVGKVIRPKGITDVQTVKSLVPDDTWTSVQRAWMDNLLKESTTPQTQTFSRRRFLAELDHYDDAVLREVLTGKQAGAERTYQGMQDLRQALTHLERIRPTVENPSGTAQGIMSAGQLIKGAQLGGALVVGSTVGLGEGGMVIVTPALLGRFLASDKGVRLILDGIHAAPGTREASKLVTRMALFMAQEGLAPEVQAERMR